MKDIETLLSERKIFQPVKRSITGTLAQSLNRNEGFKSGKIFLLNPYGDSISKGSTYSTGKFILSDVKLNQDLVLKIPAQKDMDPSDPIALYSAEGEFLFNGILHESNCVFFIPHTLIYRLMDKNMAGSPSEQLLMVNNMEFSTSEKFQLSPKDEKDLDGLINILQRVKTKSIEFKTFTDAKLSDAAAMDITSRQTQLIKNYLVKKGIPASKIKGVPRGKSVLLKICEPVNSCTEEEHRQNRRVEFLIS
jgi:outer membrane protein OmpA-like peptidoglycan-associated protein